MSPPWLDVWFAMQLLTALEHFLVLMMQRDRLIRTVRFLIHWVNKQKQTLLPIHLFIVV